MGMASSDEVCVSSKHSVKSEFLPYFELGGKSVQIEGDHLAFGAHRIPIRDGIPRFTPEVSYADNFGLQWRKHKSLQFDSQTGSNDRCDTILNRTAWPPDFFRGKTVLECGCGAGPDTEVLLRLGGTVMSVDLASADVAQGNIGENPNAQFVQASITDLPLKKKSFDVVYCHRVLQHTPCPEQTLTHILQFVKDDGAVFVHSYANTFYQRFRWKYFLLPLTRRLKPETLHRIIQWYAKPLYRFTKFTNRVKIGRIFNWVFVPFFNYGYLPQYRNLSDEVVLEHGILSTFDALSPMYDRPIRASVMRKIASGLLHRPFEVVEGRTITLLRTRLD
jgi:2-polyprenyl-3-methyl-5-hydroxy-6-metoxy-1,4-benzoquinol methylase